MAVTTAFKYILIYYLGGKVMENLDVMLLQAKMKFDEFIERMIHEEKGAADMVAILVVIVILLAVAGTFRTQLKSLVEAVFTKATTWVKDN
jgi:Flp pilus assembly pilin Flp